MRYQPTKQLTRGFLHYVASKSHYYHGCPVDLWTRIDTLAKVLKPQTVHRTKSWVITDDITNWTTASADLVDAVVHAHMLIDSTE